MQGYRLRSVAAALAAAVVLSACGAATPEQGPPDVEQAFRQMEEGLQQTGRVMVEFRITAEGALTAQLGGALLLDGDSVASLEATGEFDGQPVALSMLAMNGRMRGGNGKESFDEAVPPRLREALVIGLTRMGLLHNLAVLAGGKGPDHADGGVESWVQVENLKWTEPVAEGRLRSTGFDIRVSGEVAGEAVLWSDADGVPVLREQTVRFPSGEMRVREEYTRVLLAGR
jgi:hypothetical protein